MSRGAVRARGAKMMLSEGKGPSVLYSKTNLFS